MVGKADKLDLRKKPRSKALPGWPGSRSSVGSFRVGRKRRKQVVSSSSEDEDSDRKRNRKNRRKVGRKDK